MKKIIIEWNILYCIIIISCSIQTTNNSPQIPPPSLDNNPQLDMILTNNRPILSVGNPAGIENFSIDFQISKDSSFPADETIAYSGIKSESKGISEMQIKKGDELTDGTYYWRVRTVDNNGRKSDWVMTRFYVDTANSQTYSGFMRAEVKKVTVSSGEDPNNIIDWNDQGQITFWNSSPSAGEAFSWVKLDMGKATPVSRFWMLSTRKTTLAAGWLTHFVWQYSIDNKNWKDIPGTEIKENDTYRNIIDFEPVNARFYRLVIYSQNALQAQINAIIPYIKANPAVPRVPEGKYVLIIGNQMNGYTYTNLKEFVEKQGYKAVIVPHYEISYQVLNELNNKPIAVILSGNNANWQNLPLFEYYGEFEIIRKIDNIPMLGICAGNEFMAMAYGVSFVHWMGWFDDTMFRIFKGEIPDKVKIKQKFVDDPIFAELPNPFQAVEIHSWAITPIFLKDARYNEFKETSSTSYIQTIKSISRPVYSEQFHGAVINDYNQSGQYLKNFLEIADHYCRK